MRHAMHYIRALGTQNHVVKESIKRSSSLVLFHTGNHYRSFYKNSKKAGGGALTSITFFA